MIVTAHKLVTHFLGGYIAGLRLQSGHMFLLFSHVDKNARTTQVRMM